MLSTMNEPEKIEATLVHSTVRQGKNELRKICSSTMRGVFAPFASAVRI